MAFVPAPTTQILSNQVLTIVCYAVSSTGIEYVTKDDILAYIETTTVGLDNQQMDQAVKEVIDELAFSPEMYEPNIWD